jgi:hypothetical protein
VAQSFQMSAEKAGHQLRHNNKHYEDERSKQNIFNVTKPEASIKQSMKRYKRLKRLRGKVSISPIRCTKIS